MFRPLHSLVLFVLTGFCLSVQAQRPYGHSQAFPADTVAFSGWATSCILIRGDQNIADTSIGKTTLGNENAAIGPAKQNGMVSLGDGGSAVLQFDGHLYNGPGPDFAIFENGFGFDNDTTFYLELAFVEVSSDGLHFVRFPSRCENDTADQKNTIYGSNPDHIHNLAGKYIYGFGTPFDLDDLKDSAGINLNHITHVRIVDVVGSLNDSFARKDSYGNSINDPWPTPFPSGGFDLDAVGSLHLITGMNNPEKKNLQVYPNPVRVDEYLTLAGYDAGSHMIQILDFTGKLVEKINLNGKQPHIHLNGLKRGIYFICSETTLPVKLIVQ
ncbi:MAG: T9SS type A sorting domain-containing protein [Bacteroidia bacterium]|jgi:hypothetical protein